jgi:UPF0716 family protein affecting phage T7 exclusion
MSLDGLRNISLIYFILIAIGLGLTPGVALFFAIKGLRILRRRGLPYVHLTQFYFRRVERLTNRASRWIASPFIFAAGVRARIESTAGRLGKLFARKEAS